MEIPRQGNASISGEQERVSVKLGYAEGEGDDEAVKVACCRKLARLG